MLSRFYHIAEPFKLTLAQWNGLLDRVQDMDLIENPGVSDKERHKRTVQRESRMLKRQKVRDGKRTSRTT